MADGSWIADLSGPHGHTDGIISVAISPDGSKVVTGSWMIIQPRSGKCYQILFATLKTLTLKQIWLLEGIYEQAIMNKKADLSHIEKPEIIEYIEQYAMLPDLIKDSCARICKI